MASIFVLLLLEGNAIFELTLLEGSAIFELILFDGSAMFELILLDGNAIFELIPVEDRAIFELILLEGRAIFEQFEFVLKMRAGLESCDTCPVVWSLFELYSELFEIRVWSLFELYLELFETFSELSRLLSCGILCCTKSVLLSRLLS
uniref:Uncharacterized protein n=1 Tax=Cacopsylla melanoneura TaxID=428564 RepID=A0A8D8QFK4_9HEMI